MNISNTYQAVSLDTTFYIIDARNDGRLIGCITVEATPVMASYVWYVLVFAVLATLIGLAIVYVLASWLNPWTGTKNILIWSSNYGYDANAIRLITPGLGDFLRYLQFAFFLGCLNLEYPGFFRPLLATASWSCLLFHYSFASSKIENFSGNIYIDEGHYGMSKMARDVQLAHDRDIWPSFIIWMLILLGLVLALAVFVYLLTSRWHRSMGSLGTRSGFRIDWRRGAFFVAGIVVRLVLLFFALPLLATSFFQMLLVHHSPVVSDVFALVLIIIWVCSAVWITYKMHIMSKQVMEFTDDLPTLLVYGPLFNSFKDTHVMYFAVDLVVVFMQGLTFGAIQESGIAQITLLAVIEVIRFISVVHYKPFKSGTSMTMVTSLFSATRIVIIFLLVPFAKSLHTDETVRGWVAYVILIIHAVILLLFIVHIAQALFELFARLGGAGKDDEGTISEGPLMAERYTGPPVYGLKQLQHDGDTIGTGGNGNSNTANLIADKGGLIPQSPTDVTADTGYRRPRSQYSINPAGNSMATMKPRESVFEEVFISSPTMETSRSATTPVATASTASSANYYRRPRRRQSSNDWTMDTPAESSEAALSNNANGPKGSSKTNYAVREADLYITKRATNSLFDDEIAGEADDEYKPRDSESVNPLVYTGRDSSRSPMKMSLDTSRYSLLREDSIDETGPAASSSSTKPGIYGSVKGIMGRVGGRLKDNFSHSRDSDISAGKGFEVINRQPIRLNKPGSNNVATIGEPVVAGRQIRHVSVPVPVPASTSSSAKSTVVSNASSSGNEDPGFIFPTQASIGAAGPSKLRVVTDPLSTSTSNSIRTLTNRISTDSATTSSSTSTNVATPHTLTTSHDPLLPQRQQPAVVIAGPQREYQLPASLSTTSLDTIRASRHSGTTSPPGQARAISRQSQVSDTGSSVYQSICEEDIDGDAQALYTQDGKPDTTSP
ncbi:Flc3p [Sugiyamaella lignohabitans]|uniref:Flc3p n=1 Tax=Sugiyamaella lignohabitans TaxID=796027 RepID=A0A167DEP1_9ASCO|nr:Flc3p [Sugiyamaella lignohabitans]ANB12831.1 Flc3p [Sugiyamaella lignohabitans]